MSRAVPNASALRHITGAELSKVPGIAQCRTRDVQVVKQVLEVVDDDGYVWTVTFEREPERRPSRSMRKGGGDQ